MCSGCRWPTPGAFSGRIRSAGARRLCSGSRGRGALCHRQRRRPAAGGRPHRGPAGPGRAAVTGVRRDVCSSTARSLIMRLLGGIGVDGRKAHGRPRCALPWRYWMDSGETLMPWSSAAFATAASSQSSGRCRRPGCRIRCRGNASIRRDMLGGARGSMPPFRIEPAHAAKMAREMALVHEVGKRGLGEQRGELAGDAERRDDACRGWARAPP